MSRGFYTPWGAIDSDGLDLITEGFVIVATAGGGGYVFSERFANTRLTEAARKRAIRYGRQYCYDSDIGWSVPAFELKDLWSRMFNRMPPSFIPARDLLIHVSRWHADYLRERKIKPEPKAYKIWLATNRERMMREERHPDLIVLAHEEGDGIVVVQTADGKNHKVTSKSFDEAAKSVKVFLLCDCHKVKR